jgi:hypothetical protein
MDASSTPKKKASTSTWQHLDISPVIPVTKTYSRKRLQDQVEELSSPAKSVRSDVETTVDLESDLSVDKNQENDSTWEVSINDLELESIDLSFTAAEKNAEKVENSKIVICEVEEIEKLLQQCHKCNQENIEVKNFTKGTLMVFVGHCSNGHKTVWRSSKYVDQKPIMNTRIAAACLCSGIPYAAMHRFAKCTELAFLSESTFYEHHSAYCNPVIKKTYFDMRKRVTEEIQKLTVVVLSGDARFDSPGAGSAKFCHYSLQDVTTNLILDFVIWQKGIAPGEMESKAFHFLFDRVLTEVGQEKVKIFCSDRNLSVGKVMKVFFKTVHHAFDVGNFCWFIWMKLNYYVLNQTGMAPCQRAKQETDKGCCKNSSNQILEKGYYQPLVVFSSKLRRR